METAGVVLGGIPLILIALEKYAKVARALKDYADYDATLNRLQTYLWIQEQQYDDTMEDVGLNDVSLEDIEIHLRQNLPAKCDRIMDIIRRINDIADKISDMLNVGAPTQPRWLQESEKRFRTEMRKILLSLDLDDGDLKQLLNELDILNKALRNCFSKMEVPSAESIGNRVVRRLHACFDVDLCIAANRNAQILHGALQAGWGCTCSTPHKGNVRLAWHTERLLEPANFDMVLSYKDTSTGVDEELWRHVKVKVQEARETTTNLVAADPISAAPKKRSLLGKVSNNFKRVSIQGDRLAGSHASSATGQAVVPSPLPATSIPPASASELITVLCTDLRDCAHAKKDLGYLVHPAPTFAQHVRVHSISETPSAIVNSQELIGQTKGARLARKRRFEVAASVCWGVLLLADTDWLSEDLTRDEVQLMTDVSKNHTRDGLEYTYISCAFEGDMANATSQRPSVNTSRDFIRNRTLFALGILLMELCLNRTFPALRSELQGSQTHPASGTTVRDDLIECVDEVYDEAGNEYGYAVQRCIFCEFPGQDRHKNFQHSPFRQLFFDGVVAPVQATYEMISDPALKVLP